MPHPDSIPFCVGYAAWLGGICLIALECVRRFRHPLVCFAVGLAALALTFGFVLWLESGLVSAEAWSLPMGLPYRQFRRNGFGVFLVVFVARGLYLLRVHGRRCAAPMGFGDSMSLKVARLVRIFTAVALPVPLFVGIFYFSDFYTLYHGYNSDNGTYFTDSMSLSNCRKHAWTYFLFFVAVGYVIMIVPSFLCSISLEVYRSKPFASYMGYVTLGGAMGGVTSLPYIWFELGNIWNVFTAYILFVFIGAGIAMFLSMIGHPKLKRRAESLKGEAGA